MKKEEQKFQKKEKKLKTHSFSFKTKKQLKHRLIWWGWKTA